MGGKTRGDLAVATWDALKGASWPIFTDIARRTLETGTTPAQISLLNVLYDAPEAMTPLAVARSLQVTPGTVTSTLNRLEDEGFIERLRGKSEDRRVVQLRLLSRGRDLVRRWRESCRSHLEEVMGRLSESEQRTLISILSRLGSPEAGVPGGLASLIQFNPKAARRPAPAADAPRRSRSRVKG
jgi:DNA-binding MarR family transcriptional regulator